MTSADAGAGAGQGAGPNVERLKMIQAVIERLAKESANLKGWSVAVVGGMVVVLRTFSAGGAETDLGSLLWIPVSVLFVLAILDSYYLGAERAYRELYELALTETSDEWSLRAPALDRGRVSHMPPASVRATGRPRRREPWGRFIRAVWAGVRSPVVVFFYGLLIVALLVIMCVSKC